MADIELVAAGGRRRSRALRLYLERLERTGSGTVAPHVPGQPVEPGIADNWTDPEAERELSEADLAELADDIRRLSSMGSSDVTGFVYVITVESRRVFKVGHSRWPMDRLTKLQTANSERLYMLGVIPSGEAQVLEGKLHAALRRVHSHGEWFFWHPRIGDALTTALRPVSDVQQIYATQGMVKWVADWR